MAVAALLGYMLSALSTKSEMSKIQSHLDQSRSENTKLHKNINDFKRHISNIEREKFEKEGELNSMKLKIERLELKALQNKKINNLDVDK